MSEMKTDKLDFYSTRPLMDCKVLATRHFVFLPRCPNWLGMWSDFSAPNNSLHLEELDRGRSKKSNRKGTRKEGLCGRKTRADEKKKGPLM